MGKHCLGYALISKLLSITLKDQRILIHINEHVKTRSLFADIQRAALSQVCILTFALGSQPNLSHAFARIVTHCHAKCATCWVA